MFRFVLLPATRGVDLWYLEQGINLCLGPGTGYGNVRSKIIGLTIIKLYQKKYGKQIVKKNYQTFLQMIVKQTQLFFC